MLLLQVVKAIWQYVKSRNLQDPNDRRQIICDDALRAVCDGESAVSGFGINKYISRHLLRPAAIPPGEEEEYVSVPTKKRRKRKEREEKKKKSVKRRQTGTSGLTKPYRLSKTLAAVVGKDIMSRVDVSLPPFKQSSSLFTLCGRHSSGCSRHLGLRQRQPASGPR